VSAFRVRRAKAALSSGCKPHPAIAPAGSNRSSYGGNEVAEAQYLETSKAELPTGRFASFSTSTLGDGSGIELRHRLKAAGNTVPVIYMTGNDTPAVRTAALQSGCLAYLTKPFSAQSLIEPLERVAAGFP
jgi:DNA-binding NtrC family response regulator